MAFVVVIVGWIIIYFISKSTGDKRSQDRAEDWLTSGLGFKGCGIVLIIIIIIVIVILAKLASLFEA